MNSAGLGLAVLVAVLGSAVCVLDTCDDGYQHFLKYSDIWSDTKLATTHTKVYTLSEKYTAKYLEDYARHMCSVVKPQARSSLRNEVASCSNIDQITAMLDENEGFCQNDGLSNRIRMSIINHLPPVNNDIQCARISKQSNCYNSVAEQLKVKRLPVTSFRNEIDRFFDSIWECQVKLFKSHSHSCPHWQLPMLLSLDTTNVLFRIKITDQQIAMLELHRTTSTGTSVKKIKKKKKKKKKKFGKVKKIKGNKNKIGKLLKISKGSKPKISIGSKSKTGKKKSG